MIPKTNAHAETEKYQWLEKGKSIWVRQTEKDPIDVFTEAKVMEMHEARHEITVDIAVTGSPPRPKTIKLGDCFKLTYAESDVSDMVDLQQLNEPELLWNIKRRYLNDMIFTFCGKHTRPTLLIINPYTKIDRLFSEELLHQYQFQVLSENLEYKSMPPHIFGLACFCLWQLYDNNRNQSIVISGESGAGKTENTKYCLNFLASLGKNLKEMTTNTSSKKLSPLIMRTIDKAIKKSANKAYGIENKILGCNQILEAFGNAKTIRNDNSSRFGKLIMLLYGETPIDIKSAFITNYLLEKSRIVSLADGERNYHIFYYFLLGASEEEKLKYKLTEPISSYYFLNQSRVIYIEGKPDDNKEKFDLIKRQFELYLTPEEIDSVYRIVAAVLNLGNVRFAAKQTNGTELIVIEKENFLKNAADLLEANFAQLQHVFKYKTRKLANSFVDSPLKLDEVLALRDSLCKNLYEKLFNYLVMKLNEKIELQKMDSESEQGRRSIGILDIFGFEILARNSLEQFFINFANEKLQQLYVLYIFKQEKEEFKREGLKDFATDIGFEDNQPVIDLIEKKPVGIFYLINESSLLNNQDSMLPNVFVRKNDKCQPKYISRHRTNQQLFTINHSCTPVEYNTIGFTVKNKDEFPAQMLNIVEKIPNKELHGIINFDIDSSTTNQSTKTNEKAESKYLATKFLKHMNKLTDELYKCDCHFVRCIKPNELKRPKLFNSTLMLQSLRNLGVLDSIKIRKLGYVYRKYFKEFYKKFYEIEAYSYNFNEEVAGKTEDEMKEIVRKFVQKHAAKDLQKNMILLGTKKILIKESSLNTLESLAKEKRKQRLQVINKVKHVYLEAKARDNFHNPFQTLKVHMQNYLKHIQETILKKKVIKVQRAVRKFILQNMYKKNEAIYQRSAIIIGTWWRKVRAMKLFKKKKQQALMLQSNIRRFLGVSKFAKERLAQSLFNHILEESWRKVQNSKATLIKKTYKGWVTRLRFKDLIKQIQINKQQALLNMRVIKIQKWLRSIPHKRQFEKSRQAAMLIQAHWKRYLLQRVYKKVQLSVAVIKKHFRKFLTRKYYRQAHWAKFKGNILAFENNRMAELNRLGVWTRNPEEAQNVRIKGNESSKRVNLSEYSMLPQIASPQEIADHYRHTWSPSETDRSHRSTYNSINSWSYTPMTADKNDLQCYVLDVDILGDASKFYGEWSTAYQTLVRDMASRNDYPVQIDINENCTLVTNQKCKVYRFGEYTQNEKPYQNLDIIQEPYKIVMNEFNSYIMTLDRKMYVWGDSFGSSLEGELMLGPTKTETSSNTITLNSYLPMHKITDFSVKGNQRYLLSSQGRVYQYQPQSTQNYISFSANNQSVLETSRLNATKESQYSLKLEIRLQEQVPVKLIAASNQFVHFLGQNGCVYSKGQNKKGQLGLGHCQNVQDIAQLNQSLKNSKYIIEQVRVGMRHTIVKTNLGYVLTWGDNSFRQVSASTKLSFYPTPQLIQLDKSTNKAVQVAAGFRCCAVLLDSMRLVWWGTNSKISMSEPKKVELEKYVSYNGGVMPVRVNGCWSNNMSIMYVNCIRLGHCKKNVSREVVTKNAKALAKEWEHDQILPPHSESAETCLNLLDLKKFKFKSRNLKSSSGAPSKKGVDFQEVDLMLQLRNNTVFGTSAKQKLYEMYDQLLKKQVEDWTDEDQRIYQYLQNPKIQQLIKKL